MVAPGFIDAALDITERKRAEERERLWQLEADLAHINRVSMMGELSSRMINQPLAGIVSNGSAGLRFLTGDTPDVAETRYTTSFATENAPVKSSGGFGL